MIGSGTQAKKENGSRWMNGGTKSEMRSRSEMMRSWSEMVMMMMMATPFSCLALD